MLWLLLSTSSGVLFGGRNSWVGTEAEAVNSYMYLLYPGDWFLCGYVSVGFFCGLIILVRSNYLYIWLVWVPCDK